MYTPGAIGATSQRNRLSKAPQELFDAAPLLFSLVISSTIFHLDKWQMVIPAP